MAPRALYGVNMGACLLIDETDGTLYCLVGVPMRLKIAVRHRAITDDCSPRFDPVTDNSHQGVSCSVLNRNEKHFARLPLHTAKHPLRTLTIFASTELALIDFDGLVRTADPLRAALHVFQHDLSAVLAPVSDGCGAELMLSLDSVGRHAAHDVVCQEHNLRQSEVTLLKPGTVPD